MGDELEVNSKCLAYHGPLLYETKILKIHEPDSKVVITKEGEADLEEGSIPEELSSKKAYYIHYRGWKNTWDEWVDVTRLKPLNLENLKLQKELKSAALSSNSNSTANASAPGTTSRKYIHTSKTNGAPARVNKRRSELDLENEEDVSKRAEVSIRIPDSLKSLLVDDWELITKEHQLVQLPSKPTVSEIIRNYDSSKKNKSASESEVLKEFLSGLETYFNRSLGNVLLYRFERQQFLEITKNPELKDRELCDVYGVEHLMRLMVTMPALIAQTTMDQQSIGTLKDHLEDFLSYLDLNKQSLFQKRYENVTPGYEALAKNV